MKKMFFVLSLILLAGIFSSACAATVTAAAPTTSTTKSTAKPLLVIEKLELLNSGKVNITLKNRDPKNDLKPESLILELIPDIKSIPSLKEVPEEDRLNYSFDPASLPLIPRNSIALFEYKDGFKINSNYQKFILTAKVSGSVNPAISTKSINKLIKPQIPK